MKSVGIWRWKSFGPLREIFAAVRLHRVPIIVFVDTTPRPHWKESTAHVVLVVGFDQRHVIVNDPFFEQAEIRIPQELFNRGWSKNKNYMVIIKKRKAS